jgi:hypothetical protein
MPTQRSSDGITSRSLTSESIKIINCPHEIRVFLKLEGR